MAGFQHRARTTEMQERYYPELLHENRNPSQATGSARTREERHQNVVLIQDVSEEKLLELGPKAVLSLKWPNNPRKNCTVMARSGIQTIFRSEVEAVASAVALDITGTDTLIIKSRSKYAVSAYTCWSKEWEVNGWKTTKNTNVKHRDVFERGLRHMRDRPGDVKFVLVSPQGPIEDDLPPVVGDDLLHTLSCLRLDEE